jgi:hypothetical protein
METGQQRINNSRDLYFDYAEVLLQIAIVMSSISILSHSRLVFSVAVGASMLGSICSLNGYLLLFASPSFMKRHLAACGQTPFPCRAL